MSRILDTASNVPRVDLTHKTKRPQRKVGFFGCNGRVVRLEVVATRAPRNVQLEKCPGCGHGHTAQPFWRVWQQELDEGREGMKV